MLEGRSESDVDDNVQAVASGRERSGRVNAKRSLAGDASTEPDREGPEAVSATKSGKSAKKSKRAPRSPSPQAIDSDDPDHRTTSWHRPVSNSAIYTTYEGPILSEVRRLFQTLIFARDGSPIRTLTIHRVLNLKLALLAAKDVMDPKCIETSRMQWTSPTRTPARSKCSHSALFRVCMVSTKPAPTNAHGPCAALQGHQQLDQGRGLVYGFCRHPLQQRDEGAQAPRQHRG